MKNYIATVIVHNNGDGPKKIKLAIGPIAAESKEDSFKKALAIVEADETVGNYSKLTCKRSRVTTMNP